MNKGILIAIVLVLIVAVGGYFFMMKKGGSSPTTQPSASSNSVTIQSMAFSPQDIKVKVGEKVTWTNQDSVTHTVTSDTGAFDSGSVANGGTFSFTFTKEGTFPYHCNIHTSMTGQVTVSK